MSIGRGKLIEDLKFALAGLPQAVTTTKAYFNGSTTTGAGVAIDTQPYDEIVFGLLVGAMGAGGTMEAAVWESDTDNTEAASAVTGADFTDVTTANDYGGQLGSIKCKNYKRYMYIRTVSASATSVTFASGAVLGRADGMPIANEPVFDLNHA